MLKKDLARMLAREVLRLRARLHGSDRGREKGHLLLDILEDDSKPGLQHPPAVARRLMNKLRRRNVSLNELIETAGKDPALVQSILRHANSAFYGAGQGNPIITVRAAVQRIGTGGLHSVVTTELARGLICRPGPKWNAMAEAVWSHMVRTAEIGRTIARAFVSDPEEAYTVCLLHDVGKLVVFAGLTEVRKRSRSEVDVEDAFVDDVLSSLHGPLGGLAALEWGLGEQVASAITHHHRDPIPTDDSGLHQAVFLAERIDLAEVRGSSPDLDRLWEDGALDGAPSTVHMLLADRSGAEGQ